MALSHVHGDGEGVSEGDSSKEHLDTDEEVLVSGADSARPGGRRPVIRLDGLNGPRLLKDGQEEALPVREEDDGLDSEELQDWLVGSEQVFGGEVKEKECVESQGDTDVVDDGGVDVAVSQAPVSVVVEA